MKGLCAPDLAMIILPGFSVKLSWQFSRFVCGLCAGPYTFRDSRSRNRAPHIVHNSNVCTGGKEVVAQQFLIEIWPPDCAGHS